MKDILISAAHDESREAVVELLNKERLPVDDLPSHLDHFILAMDDSQVIAAIGLEKYEPYGLLRSLVVRPDYRNQYIAGKLIGQLELNAAASGLKEIYLLTETAPDYFVKKGYVKINRLQVPEVLMQSSEFSHSCPRSAIVMKKKLKES
jgi:amino-acid N-acetyltransferase